MHWRRQPQGWQRLPRAARSGRSYDCASASPRLGGPARPALPRVPMRPSARPSASAPHPSSDEPLDLLIRPDRAYVEAALHAHLRVVRVSSSRSLVRDRRGGRMAVVVSGRRKRGEPITLAHSTLRGWLLSGFVQRVGTYVRDPPARCSRPVPPRHRAQGAFDGRGRRPRAPGMVARGHPAASPSLRRARLSVVRAGGEAVACSLPPKAARACATWRG
jgi:hypothetical protein